jgi:hypothetical protein
MLQFTCYNEVIISHKSVCQNIKSICFEILILTTANKETTKLIQLEP